MKGAPNGFVVIAALIAGLVFAIKPEKAMWNGNKSKIGILVTRIIGIVILALFVVAAVLTFIGQKTGQITP